MAFGGHAHAPVLPAERRAAADEESTQPTRVIATLASGVGERVGIHSMPPMLVDIDENVVVAVRARPVASGALVAFQTCERGVQALKSLAQASHLDAKTRDHVLLRAAPAHQVLGGIAIDKANANLPATARELEATAATSPTFGSDPQILKPGRTTDERCFNAGAGALRRSQFTASVIDIGGLIGIGVAGFVDETVFHQLLHWHHFYNLSTPAVGLVSDGIFHAVSWFCVVGGLFMFADLRRRAAWRSTWQFTGLCFGLGGFQLWDGIIQHKWWHLHEIRYHVKILPYDLVWNVIAVIVLVVGFVLLRRARQEPAALAA